MKKKGGKVIRGLFSVYTDKNYNKDLKLLPPEYRSLVTQYSQERLVIDYIAGMMDSFAVKEFIQYFGESEYQKAYNNGVKTANSAAVFHSQCPA